MFIASSGNWFSKKAALSNQSNNKRKIFRYYDTMLIRKFESCSESFFSSSRCLWLSLPFIRNNFDIKWEKYLCGSFVLCCVCRNCNQPKLFYLLYLVFAAEITIYDFFPIFSFMLKMYFGSFSYSCGFHVCLRWPRWLVDKGNYMHWFLWDPDMKNKKKNHLENYTLDVNADPTQEGRNSSIS